ncbi:tyrosinase precursor [Fusarium heterosporum]|uniref:tyrosinase n=1 Tax=Fusarium heterosporum TaxID=42747 RepID=A0A8H5TN65_FUSHE|nr:tyrosinase precursor [Fusarium heterosporum]
MGDEYSDHEEQQRVWENMKLVIEDWETESGFSAVESEIWHRAADNWRMPYWDWARRQEYDQDLVLPKVLTEESVHIYPPATAQGRYAADGLYPNPLLRFENPEKTPETGVPLPFGKLPGDKSSWNIEDNPAIHEELPLKEECDWAPWSKTSATSRYGIFRVKGVTEAEKDPVHHFTGLQGVNNCRRANERLATVHQNNNGKSQWSRIESRPNGHSWNPGSLADAVNRMFSKGYNSTWGNFASTKWIAESEGYPETGYISLEYIHNNVHNLTGGSDYAVGMGHMSDVPVAAFDPIFWLHHVQIDRLLAIWQCLYPELWFDKEQSVTSDLDNSKRQNVADDKETDLLHPFHTKHNDPENEVWTSQACRDWTDMNYQYDDLAELAEELVRSNGKFDEEAYKNELHAHINALYPGTGNMIQSITEHGVDPVGLQASNGDTGSWNDYIINVMYDRYAMDGLSYTIEFFLGGPENEDSTHFHKHNYVGHVYSFGGRLSTSKGSCSNCKRQAEDDTLSCAQVPLTINLLQHLQDDISDHSIADFGQVEDYLRLHLRWRFVKYGGEVVSDALFKEKFSKTQISVLRGIGRSIHLERAVTSGLDKAPLEYGPEVTHALIPIYSGYAFLPEVTDGKPGGLQMEQIPNENESSSLWNLEMEVPRGQIGEIRAHL